MTTKLKWRLGKLPSPYEVQELVKDKIITQEEARDILFNTETDEERDKDSLKDEIKFLREVIENLSKNNKTQTVEVLKYVYPSYNYPWVQPYAIWCGGTSPNHYSLGSVLSSNIAVNTTDGSSILSATNANNDTAFTSVQTF